MKKTTQFLMLCFFMCSLVTFAQERNCAAMDDLDRRLQEDPQLELRMQQIENYTQEKIKDLNSNNRVINGDIITIPVVVHILYNNSTTNISDAQIQSQIDVLNEDFRRLNSDADNTWSQASDAQIEFCMATVDPNGNATNGITRKSTTQESWVQSTNNMKKTAQGGIDPWNTAEYLNMWTVPRLIRSNGQTLLGFAQFPGGPASTDGVVMGYNYFGRIGQVSAPFDLGRTTTHEVGHFLNLRHIWGDGPCGSDDFVADTPESDASNGGCNTTHVSCGSVDMVQNYMDYSDDSCMNLFTQGQVDRMRVTLLPGGVRATLGASSKCGAAPTPTCTDGVQNGSETGVDCGGPDCGPCAPDPTCNDGVQNGDETGIDCGGSSCAPCAIACSSTVDTFDYSESFESNLGAWTNDSGDDVNWTRDSGGTPSRNTGPSSGADGSYYIFVEASGSGTGYPNKQAIISSPCFDLTNETAASFDYSYHMYGANDMGSIALEASTDGATWTSLWSETGNQGNSWLSNSIDLSAYLGGTVRLRFNRITGGTWQADIALDNFNVTTAGGGGNTDAPTGYCNSNGNNTNDEYIQRVQIGSIDNSTGASSGGYGDYTNLSTSLNGSNTITITPLWTGTVYSEGYAVWVDWNRDGDFGDAGELAYSQSATQSTSVSGTITVPGGASVGFTRMRVSMKYNGIPNSCESFTYGEVEDYIVEIGGGARVGSELPYNALTMEVYPNPVKGNALNIAMSGAATTYEVFNLTGQLVQKGAYTSTIEVADLAAGIYILKVQAEGQSLVERFIKE
ncbi:MAG: T9SS type A sorting domain-containing protein [Bacteroidetes bacterium]|nr:T9SS type A sorting domain-containing protein [Bacteroidota bacterium]